MMVNGSVVAQKCGSGGEGKKLDKSQFFWSSVLNTLRMSTSQRSRTKRVTSSIVWCIIRLRIALTMCVLTPAAFSVVKVFEPFFLWPACRIDGS